MITVPAAPRAGTLLVAAQPGYFAVLPPPCAAGPNAGWYASGLSIARRDESDQGITVLAAQAVRRTALGVLECLLRVDPCRSLRSNAQDARRQ